MKERRTAGSASSTVTDFLNSANDGAKAVGALHIAFVAFLAYVGSIVWSTTHVDLLRNAPVQLPILQVKLSLVGFFQYVPWLVVLLHFNLLIQLYLLSRKLWLLDKESATSSAPAQLKQRLFIFPFAHYLVGSERAFAIRILLGSAVGISIIAFPLFILVYAQVTFLPFHDEVVTWWMRAAVWADVLLLLVLWPLLSSPTNRWRDWWKVPSFRSRTSALRKPVAPRSPLHSTSERSRLRNGLLLLSAVFCATLLSVLALVPSGALRPLSMEEYRSTDIESRCDVEAVQAIVDEVKLHSAQEELIRKHCQWEPAYSLERWLVRVLPAFLLSASKRGSEPTGQTLRATAWLFDDDAAPWRRDLALRDERLLSEQTPVEVMTDLKSQSTNYVKNKTLEKALGLSLRGRDLRRADLSGAVLIGANLRDVQLQDARLENALLHGVDLSDSHLQRTTGAGVFLTGANLGGARLQGVFFPEAHLERADLSYARLQLGTFTKAHFEGASLASAKADFANFSGAKMPGAYLAGANLRGADLSKSDLRGAIVGVSELQFANLLDAKLQGADLNGSNVYCGRLSERQHGCALVRLTERAIDKDELRSLARAALPYSRNAMEASGLLMGAELAHDRCGPIPFQTRSFNSCDFKDIASRDEKARWFDEPALYRRHARSYLLDLACGNEAIAHGVARNFREMWQEDAAEAAKALLARVGKCRGLMNLPEQFTQALEEDIRTVHSRSD